MAAAAVAGSRIRPLRATRLAEAAAALGCMALVQAEAAEREVPVGGVVLVTPHVPVELARAVRREIMGSYNMDIVAVAVPMAAAMAALAAAMEEEAALGRVSQVALIPALFASFGPERRANSLQLT